MKPIYKAVDEQDYLRQVPVIVNPEKFYGAKNSYGQIGFISREDFDKGNFQLRSENGFTNGNGWDNYHNLNLASLINNLISKNWNVFEFNTFKDLMTWIINSGSQTVK